MPTDALDAIRDLLAFYRLPASLAEFIWNNGVVESLTDEQFWQSLRQRPEYETRFPGLNAMRDTGNAISERDWVAYENQAIGLMRDAGLPSGFYDDPGDIGAFITNRVSYNELAARVAQAEVAAQSISADVRDEFAAYYGIGAGDLTAYFLDPDVAEPLLAERWAASQVGAGAKRTGYGTLDQSEAERLGNRAPIGQIEQGFTRLATDRQLYQSLDQGEQAISRDTQLSTLEGNAQATETIEQRRRRRQAEFGQGGQFGADQQSGFSVGSTRT